MKNYLTRKNTRDKSKELSLPQAYMHAQRLNNGPLRSRLLACLSYDRFISHRTMLGEKQLDSQRLNESVYVILLDYLPEWFSSRKSDLFLTKLASRIAAALRSAFYSLERTFILIRRGLRSIRYTILGDRQMKFARYRKSDFSCNERIIFEPSIELLHYDLSDQSLKLKLRRICEISGPYILFVHAHPESGEAPISLDCAPSIPFSEWPLNNWVYNWEVNFSQLPSGHYRISIGIYESLRFSRLRPIIDGASGDSLDCGSIFRMTSLLQSAA